MNKKIVKDCLQEYHENLILDASMITSPREEYHKDSQPIDEIYVDNNRIAAMGGCVLN